MEPFFYLYDHVEKAGVRYVSFQGGTTRFDLAIIQTTQFVGKLLVLDLQGKNYAIIGEDDLNEDGYLEYAFALSEEHAAELKAFLLQTI